MTSCDTVRDLISLHAEGMASDSSVATIEEHVRACPSCNRYQQDVTRELLGGEAEEPPGLDALVSRVSRYQNSIKLAAVYVALLLSCIVAGLGVQFLSTLPLLVLTPFVGRLFYHKAWPILAGALPAGLVGGLLGISANIPDFAPKFVGLTLAASVVGVLAAALVDWGRKRESLPTKTVAFGLAAIVLVTSCAVSFALFGDPVSYVSAYARVNHYVQTTYPKGTLTLAGLGYDRFNDTNFYGVAEYTLFGNRQQTRIVFYPDGVVADGYKDVLESRFTDEQLSRFYAYVLPGVGDAAMSAGGTGSDLAVSAEDLAHQGVYEGIALDTTLTASAATEAAKIGFAVAFGSADDYSQLSKEEFLKRSAAVFTALKRSGLPFATVDIKAALPGGTDVQVVSFGRGSTLDDMVRSYGASSGQGS